MERTIEFAATWDKITLLYIYSMTVTDRELKTIRRRLGCLECPFSQHIDLNSAEDVVKLVIWLEDRKIRVLEVADRTGLRTHTPQWGNAMRNYLLELECPYQWSDDNVFICLSWLVSHAISLEYEDCSGDLASMEDRIEEVPVDDISLKIDHLGSLLNLHRSSETDLDFLRRIVRECMLKLRNAEITANDCNLESFPNIHHTSDPDVNKVCLVLRMLYLLDMRELQTELNSLIVLGQEYTANPKTNAALGEVGR